MNLDFTKVVSPIDGQISRYYYTQGNLVNQDQTLLTTIVSLDPMQAYFDMDESTWLQLLDAVKEGKIAASADGDVNVLLGLPVLIGLENEDGYPHTATIDFIDNQINSTTGSITVRGVVANPPLVPAKRPPSAPRRGRRPKGEGR